MSMPRRCSRFTVAAVVTAPLLLALPLAAQDAPCGIGNARFWCVDQLADGVAGDAETGDLFGAALAFGDFNADGFLDLAVGIPGQTVIGELNAGAVQVFPGKGLHPVPAPGSVHTQSNTFGDDGGPETGDRFGAALAVGDFDGDGFDDLAIGAPGESMLAPGNCAAGVCNEIGLVQVMWGSALGLQGSLASAFDFIALELDFNEPAIATMHMAEALAAIDTDGDGFASLVVGAPGAVFSDGSVGNGLVATLEGNASRTFGSPSILKRISEESLDHLGAAVAVGRFSISSVAQPVGGCPDCDPGGAGEAGVTVVPIPGGGQDEWAQTDFGAAGNASNDHFGAALAVGDFDGDGNDDLAIGAPDKDDLSATDSGRVYLLFGSGAGLQAVPLQLIRWSTFPGQTAENNDRLGAALAAGDFDGDGKDDLFIGAPNKGNDDRGFVYYVHGTTGSLTVGAGYNFSAPSVGGSAQSNEHFGAVLAAADLDGDGIDELAIGVPDENIGSAVNAGRVYVSRLLDPGWIFGDGFEGDATASWSNTVP